MSALIRPEATLAQYASRCCAAEDLYYAAIQAYELLVHIRKGYEAPLGLTATILELEAALAKAHDNATDRKPSV